MYFCRKLNDSDSIAQIMGFMGTKSQSEEAVDEVKTKEESQQPQSEAKREAINQHHQPPSMPKLWRPQPFRDYSGMPPTSQPK